MFYINGYSHNDETTFKQVMVACKDVLNNNKIIKYCCTNLFTNFKYNVINNITTDSILPEYEVSNIFSIESMDIEELLRNLIYKYKNKEAFIIKLKQYEQTLQQNLLNMLK